jgi:hypothetical protein
VLLPFATEPGIIRGETVLNSDDITVLKCFV